MPEPVAFSLSTPFSAAARETFAHPVRTFAPTLVLLAPTIPLLAGLDLLLREGGSAALQGWIAGAPAGTPNTLIARPTSEGWWTLAGIAVLLVTLLGAVLAAGLVPGAVSRAGRRSGSSVRASAAEWPALLVALVAQLLAVAAAAALLVALSVFAGRVRFQLGAVVLFFGLGALAVGLVRASLWPAIAVRANRSILGSLRHSWRLTEGSVVRLLGAACLAGGMIVIPALILRAALRAVLTALADYGVITLSPIAIDLWALIPLPLAAVVLVVVWGREAPRLAEALEARRAQLDQPTSAG